MKNHRPNETRVDAAVRRFGFIITIPVKFPVIIAFLMYVSVRACLAWLICGDDKLFHPVPFQKQIDEFVDWPL